MHTGFAVDRDIMLLWRVHLTTMHQALELLENNQPLTTPYLGRLLYLLKFFSEQIARERSLALKEEGFSSQPSGEFKELGNLPSPFPGFDIREFFRNSDSFQTYLKNGEDMDKSISRVVNELNKYIINGCKGRKPEESIRIVEEVVSLLLETVQEV